MYEVAREILAIVELQLSSEEIALPSSDQFQHSSAGSAYYSRQQDNTSTDEAA